MFLEFVTFLKFSEELPVSLGLRKKLLHQVNLKYKFLLPCLVTSAIYIWWAKLDTALGSLDFMVSIDFYTNETTGHANYILPPTISMLICFAFKSGHYGSKWNLNAEMSLEQLQNRPHVVDLEPLQPYFLGRLAAEDKKNVWFPVKSWKISLA